MPILAVYAFMAAKIGKKVSSYMRSIPVAPSIDSAILAPIQGIIDSIKEPAIILAQDYRILQANKAYRKHYLVAGDCSGRTCHDISHGSSLPCWQADEPCPLLDAMETGEPQRVLHIHHSSKGDEHVEVEVRPISDSHGSVICYIEILRQSKAASPEAGGKGMVGRSRAFNKMLELIQRVAMSEATALLLGESGTGKELAAQAIHDLSPRRDQTFVPVECSGLTESLFESELFGHEKGAFTGASRMKPGLVEQARGGTLFLDEVGDIPLALQVKLLRLLETGTFRRVGGVEPRKADFRLICATHRDLKQMVKEEKFRKDLYYRITVFPIPLPSLNERRQDIHLLAQTLLQRVSGCSGKTLSPEALARLEEYHFPGNIRELRNILERACLLTDGELIQPASLLLDNSECKECDFTCRGLITLDELEKQYLRQITAEYRYDRARLAEELGVSERTLFRKMKRIKLDSTG